MDHKSLPVAGYVPQSDDKVALVNENKVLEERVLRQIDKMQRMNAVAHDADPRRDPPLCDPRMIALARTGIKEAFMWLNRAVFQPSRIALPEDAAPEQQSAFALDEPKIGEHRTKGYPPVSTAD